MQEVEASLITKRKIFYECPNCWTNKSKSRHYDSPFYKNGKLAIHRINLTHSHGNDEGELEGNWETERLAHCDMAGNRVLIKITDRTVRME